MLKNKTIAVVIPCYNEEKQIGMVIETMPDFVDRIIIVNDKSKDDTAKVVESYIEKYKFSGTVLRKSKSKLKKTRFNRAEFVLEEQSKTEISFFTDFEVISEEEAADTCRIVLINHLQNGGVGAAIATGYKWAKDNDIDCTAVMAGDGQMDPDELESICMPVIDEGVDYVKGNRLIHRSALLVIPKVRYFGNSVLSILTKIASGYWHISDTQTGYTAISNRALNAIRLHQIYKRYGMPNDMLVKLNIAMCTIKEVEIKPVYDVGEKSKMKIHKVIPTVSWLLIKLFFKRLWFKYLFRDFHPLFLLYHFTFLIVLINIPLGIDIAYSYFVEGSRVSPQSLIAFLFFFISGFQSLLFAMWMDIQDNERLYKS
ncbi:MAG: glycosyltransferase family 2 protein [Candidatus Kapabacteria bacterium]|nr:glycosyltransferase family 2 protein [Ignavibacteriota bacterium]MCW5884403.1 glycosyltransferase family 2 protein [Candidatus Kapabacteria bacterium]